MSEPRATDHRFALRRKRSYRWSPGANSDKRQEFVLKRVTYGTSTLIFHPVNRVASSGTALPYQVGRV